MAKFVDVIEDTDVKDDFEGEDDVGFPKATDVKVRNTRELAIIMRIQPSDLGQDDLYLSLLSPYDLVETNHRRNLVNLHYPTAKAMYRSTHRGYISAGVTEQILRAAEPVLTKRCFFVMHSQPENSEKLLSKWTCVVILPDGLLSYLMTSKKGAEVSVI